MKRTHVFTVIVGVAVAVLLPAGAQEFKGRSIKAVEIGGLQRISEQLVRSKLEVQAGQDYSSPTIARDIRRLYDLGYFTSIKADAQLEGDEVVVTYLVEEKRLIDEIRILGNDKVRERHIRAALTWREGDAFIPDAYNDEREAILEVYESKGFPNASVDIIVEETGLARVRVTYTIEEEEKARIRRIRFVGNDSISRRKLRKSMETKRAWWFLGGKYDEDVFEDDLQNILDEYGNYGRLEAEVVRTEFAYSENGKRVDVTIHLSEGPEYRVASMEPAANVVYDDDEVLGVLEVQAGDVHDRGQVEADAAVIAEGYHDSGYVNTRVTPQVTLDRDKKTSHVVHRIAEGDLKYVKEVNITGNTVTRDAVVRREIMVLPGERFDGTLIEGSRKRLEHTEYYDDVRFTLEDVEDDDRYSNLLVDVEEGKTGFFNFGGGYSTEEKFGGFAELRFTNFDIANWPTFSGGGQQFRARLHLGDRRTQYYLSFTDPEIAGYPVAFGIDLFDETYKYSGGIDYTEESRGGQIRFGKMLSPFTNVRASLLYRDSSVDDLPRLSASRLDWQQGGSTTISTVWGISRDTRDSRRDTAMGASHDLQLELAGLGGDNHFYKLEHDSTWYWPLDKDEKWILSFRTREGWANEYGSSEFVPITDRFFAGGTGTIRGYDHRDVGPSRKRFVLFGEEDRVGGDLRVVGNLELKYKLTDQLRFYAFVDSGNVWESVDDFDFGGFQHGVGLGFGIDVPRLGPIRVDYGFALNPEEGQGGGRWHLMTGFRF